MSSVIPEILSRATLNDYDEFVPGAIIDLINLDQESPTKLELITTICDVQTPQSILLETRGKGRKCLLNHMSESELKELFAHLGHEVVGDPWEFAINLKFSSELENKLLEYFNLERPIFENNDNEVIEHQKENIITNYGLFRHQLDAIQRVSRYLNRGEKVILHMPTGSGKTRTAMRIICEHINNKICESETALVFWLADSEELCAQAASEFKKAWNALGLEEISLFRFYGNYECSLDELQTGLVVGGLQKLNNAFENRASRNKLLSRTTLVVFDEAHRIIAPTYEAIVNHLAVSHGSVLGLTATPGRDTDDLEKNKIFADYFDNNKEALEIEGFDSPIDYLQSKGYLSVPTYEHLEIQEAEHNFSQKELRNLKLGGDFSDSMLKKLGDDSKRNLKIAARSIEVLDKGLQTIIFACSVPHAEALTILLKYKNQKVGLVTGKTDKEIRKQNIDDYKNGKLKGLINFGVLTTGFDAPKTEAVIITRPTTSLSLYSQMVGRATRGPKVGGTKTCEVHTVIDTQFTNFNDLTKSFYNWDEYFI